MTEISGPLRKGNRCGIKWLPHLTVYRVNVAVPPIFIEVNMTDDFNIPSGTAEFFNRRDAEELSVKSNNINNERAITRSVGHIGKAGAKAYVTGAETVGRSVAKAGKWFYGASQRGAEHSRQVQFAEREAELREREQKLRESEIKRREQLLASVPKGKRIVKVKRHPRSNLKKKKRVKRHVRSKPRHRRKR